MTALSPLSFAPDANGTYANRTAYAALGPGATGTCLLSADETGGAFSLFTVTLEPGAGVAAHIHQNEDEAFCVLDGQVNIQLGDEMVSVVRGGSAWGPRGVAHGLQSVGDVPARLLVAATPGGFENFFGELNTFGPLPGEGEADMMGRALALLAKHGMTPAAPVSETAAQNAHLVGPRNDDLIELGDHRAVVRVGAKQSGGALLWMSVEVDGMGGVPSHVHHEEDEAFYIVEGRFALEVGGRYFEANAGDVAFAPRGIDHTWQCISSEGGRAEAFVTPGANFETFFRTMAQMRFVPAVDMANPARIAELLALTAKHNIEMLPPSIK